MVQGQKKKLCHSVSSTNMFTLAKQNKHVRFRDSSASLGKAWRLRWCALVRAKSSRPALNRKNGYRRKLPAPTASVVFKKWKSRGGSNQYCYYCQKEVGYSLLHDGPLPLLGNQFIWHLVLTLLIIGLPYANNQSHEISENKTKQIGEMCQH